MDLITSILLTSAAVILYIETTYEQARLRGFLLTKLKSNMVDLIALIAGITALISGLYLLIAWILPLLANIAVKLIAIALAVVIVLIIVNYFKNHKNLQDESEGEDK